MSRRMRAWAEVESKLPKLLENLDELQRDIIRLRWIEEAKKYDRRWVNQRFIYYGLRLLIISGAATVPVLAGLNVAKLATALIGLAVSILTGLDSLLQFGVRWRARRQGADAIEFEGWEFVELAGDIYGQYTDHSAAYKPFLRRLEKLNETFSREYLELFTNAARTRKDIGAGTD